ncbi:MAG: hypothetical protein H0Z32_05755 [Bacillaceae bacterium]|nr:hypothetical protein [Bacillaceae bacterium]
MDRLYYFFSTAGQLPIEKVEKIKPNVFAIRSSNKAWIIKSYGNKRKVQLLWNATRKLKGNENRVVGLMSFPNGKKWIENQDQYWCLMPYIKGRTLSFSSHEDRLAAIQTLHQFHENTEGLDLSPAPKKRSYVKRMESRLLRFNKTGGIFFNYNYYSLFKRIKKHSVKTYEAMEQLNWRKHEEWGRENKKWIHGDSASHNFIRKGDSVFLIDLDLMHKAPYDVEWLQLAQRFLYACQWDFECLNQYFTLREALKSPYFLQGILFPGDLLREWLFFLAGKPDRRHLISFLTRMEEGWRKRERFVRELGTVI